MTNLITLTIPNDDHVALRAFGKALEEMAREREPHKTVGELNFKVNIDTTDATAKLEELNNKITEHKIVEPEVDTTAQQVESLSTRADTLHEIESLFEATPTTDSTGTPWDERIHSASKALNSDGTWRLRRKPKDMDDMEWSDYVKSIQSVLSGETPTREEADELIEASNEMLAEIRASIEPPVTPPGDDFHTDAGVVTEQTVAGIPPIPVPPTVVVPPVTDWDFPKLMVFLTERHGKIDVPTVNSLLAIDGLVALTDLNAHPDKIGSFVARVKAHLGE